MNFKQNLSLEHYLEPFLRYDESTNDPAIVLSMFMFMCSFIHHQDILKYC
jgi:hypothetical protein